MGMIVPGGITGPPCGGGGPRSGLGICIGEFVGMTDGTCPGVIEPIAGCCCCCCGAYCASGMDILGAINGGATWWAADAPSDDAGY